MTTLIIHPKFEIQQKYAQDIAQDYLGQIFNWEKLHPDLHILDGRDHNSIGIDDVRNLIKHVQYQPYSAPFQVGIIFLANLLTIEAQNSLLKTLEEPGPTTQFILTTPHEKYLLATISSRSNKIYVKEGLQTEEQGTDASDFFQKELADQLIDIDELLNAEKEEPGKIKEFLASLLITFRQQLLTATTVKDAKLADEISQKIRKINKALYYISRNANKRLTLENLVLQLS